MNDFPVRAPTVRWKGPNAKYARKIRDQILNLIQENGWVGKVIVTYPEAESLRKENAQLRAELERMKAGHAELISRLELS